MRMDSPYSQRNSGVNPPPIGGPKTFRPAQKAFLLYLKILYNRFFQSVNVYYTVLCQFYFVNAKRKTPARFLNTYTEVLANPRRQPPSSF